MPSANIECFDPWEEARRTWCAVATELAGSHGILAILAVDGASLDCLIGTTSLDYVYKVPWGSRAFPDLRPVRPDTVVLASDVATALARAGRRLGLVHRDQRYLWARTLGELSRVLARFTGEELVSLGIAPAHVATIGESADVLRAALDMLGKPAAYVAQSTLREGALHDVAHHRPARLALVR